MKFLPALPTFVAMTPSPLAGVPRRGGGAFAVAGGGYGRPRGSATMALSGLAALAASRGARAIAWRGGALGQAYDAQTGTLAVEAPDFTITSSRWYKPPDPAVPS